MGEVRHERQPVATVDDNGAVKVMGSGEAAITVWFSSKVAFARIVSPFKTGFFDRINKIDKMRSHDADLADLVNPVKDSFSTS